MFSYESKSADLRNSKTWRCGGGWHRNVREGRHRIMFIEIVAALFALLLLAVGGRA